MSYSSEEDDDLGLDFDVEWLTETRMNGPYWLNHAKKLAKRGVSAMCSKTWVAVASACLVLEGETDDERETSQVAGTCHIARRAVIEDEETGEAVTLARACHIPLAGVKSAVQLLRGAPVFVTTAAVPKSYAESAMMERLTRCEQAAAAGAVELEVMASPNHCGGARWEELFNEVVAMREAAHPAALVVTLPSEELGSLCAVKKAALVVMMAGANFVEVTPRPDSVGSISVGVAVVLAIKDFHERTGTKVGYGVTGAQSAAAVLLWLSILQEKLGQDWCDPKLFRFTGELAKSELSTVWTQLELNKGTLSNEYQHSL